MAVLDPTPTGIAALADDRGLAPRGIFAVSWAFLLRQPVGAIGMVLVLIFGLAGIFAVDSIPAVLAITLNTFIVYTSNIFAILGLRSLFFALSSLMDIFEYLHYGISALLVFVGLKMLTSHYYVIRTDVSLGIIATILVITIVASALHRGTNSSSNSKS